MRYWIKKISVFLLYIIACLIISMAIFGVVLKALTPVINDYKSNIEHSASNMLHAEIHIESIEANWVRFGPEVRLKGIVIAQDEKNIIKIDSLSMYIDLFKSAWRRSVYFRSLSLSGSEVSIDEIAPNQYLINEALSVDLSGETSSQFPEILTWFVSQNHIRLSHVALQLQQLNQNLVSVELKQANLYQSDKGESKKGLSIFAEGSVLAKTAGNTKKIKSFKSDVTLSSWIYLLGQKITFSEVELLNRDIVLQEGNDIFHYPSFEGVFVWQPVKDQWILQGKKIALTKKSYESTDYSFELWRFSDHYAAHLNAVNLSELAIFLDFFNLVPKNFDLKKANIHGSIENIDLLIPEDLSVVNQYQFSAILNNISSNAYQALPEIHHLSGAFSGSISQGDFMLLDEEDVLSFPLYFNQPLSIEKVTANGHWNFANKSLSLWLNSMHAIASTVEAYGAMKLEIPFESSNAVKLSLLAQYNLKQSQDAVKFLPMKEFDVDFSKWLTAAIGTGLGSEGKVLIRGSIDDFPYSKKEGVFIVDGSVKPVNVSFSPEWPRVKNVSGELILHNQQFGMNIAAGFEGLKIKKVKVSVPDYQADNVFVNIELEGAGEASKYLDYIHHTPLNLTLGKWLSPFSLSGPGILTFHLGLPIAHLDSDHIQVDGQWLAQGDSFSWKAFTNAGVKNIKGALHFTQESISANHVSATLENEPLELTIRTEKEKNSMTAIDVDAQGAFSIPELNTLSKTDWLSSYLSGRSQFHAHLRVPMTTPEYLISFNTDLQGMKVNLPENLGKEAKNVTPFSAQISLNPTTDIAQLLLNYTKNISATINVQHYSQEKARTLQIDARAVAFSWPLSVDCPKNSAGSNSSLWPSVTALNVHLSHLSLYKNDFSSVLISGARRPSSFLWKIKANEADGQVDLPVDSKQPINANFTYITLPAKKKTTVETASTDLSAKTAATWPPFYIEIQQFKMGKLNWGKTILQTTPIINGVKFDKIDLQNKFHHIFAHGRWVNEGAKDTTYLEGEFNTNNLGKFLSVSDITQNFDAKEGIIKYNIRWLGSPMNFQLKTLEGDADIDVKNGVIPLSGDSAKNGLGKVLTLFSAQSIQRRLQLDFSDLGENGYSFNTLISTMHFQGGNAKVKKGAFDGPEAKIGFTGRLGLVKQDYDLYLVVTPYVTSSLPLLATLAGGPIAGVATYAFDKLAAGSIAKFTSYKYLLRGPWTQPQLISLDLEAEKKPEKKNIAPVTDAT